MEVSPLKDTLTRTVMDETLKDKGFNQQTTRVDMKNDTNRTRARMCVCVCVCVR